MLAVDPQDGQALLWNSANSRWELSDISTSGGTVTPISVDIDFSNELYKDVTVPITEETAVVLRGRLYIDQDPGSAFDEWCWFTFYNKTTKKGEDIIARNVVKISYTELEVATTGSDYYITPDDHTIFAEQNLGRFIDNGELVRIATNSDTMVVEDIVGAHGIDTGLSRVSEFSGFSLFNAESGTDVYLRVEFGSTKTVSLKMDLVVVV